MLDPTTLAHYQLLTSSCGYVKLLDLTVMRIAGEDRKKFLHNFCTADINNLDAGKNCEAFVLNEKGKILGILQVISTEDYLDVVTVPEQFKMLHQHLDKYIFREDVTITNVASEQAIYFVGGPDASSSLASLTSVPDKNENSTLEMEESGATVAHLEWAGWGYMAIVETASEDLLLKSFETMGIQPASELALHVVRIEEKTPRYLDDVDDTNLPQELQRDEKAISFTKGCYLGQETVARIDALGRVNRLLVGFGSEQEITLGSDLVAGEKKIGSVTSVGWSPNSGGWIGMGIVRREFSEKGKTIRCGEATLTVS